MDRLAESIYHAVQKYKFISLSEVTHFSRSSHDLYYNVFCRLVEGCKIDTFCPEACSSAVDRDNINTYIQDGNVRLLDDMSYGILGLDGRRFVEYLRMHRIHTGRIVQFACIDNMNKTDRLKNMKKTASAICSDAKLAVLYIGYHFNHEEMTLKCKSIYIGAAAYNIIHPTICHIKPSDYKNDASLPSLWLQPWDHQVVRNPPTEFERERCRTHRLIKPVRGDKIRNYGLLVKTPFLQSEHHDEPVKKFLNNTLTNANKYDFVAAMPESIPMFYKEKPKNIDLQSIQHAIERAANVLWIFKHREDAADAIIFGCVVRYLDIDALAKVGNFPRKRLQDEGGESYNYWKNATVADFEQNPPILLLSGGKYTLIDGEHRLAGADYQIRFMGREYIDPVKCLVIPNN